MKNLILAVVALAGACLFGAQAAPRFVSARPVWLAAGGEKPNVFVAFRAPFTVATGEKPVLRVTGSSVYRIKVNGAFAGYGPARAAKGFFRVDAWPLAALVRPGANEIAIEVAAYNINTFYIPEQPGFLQAEVVAGDRVLAATDVPGAFAAYTLPRVQKCSRFSYQRAFNEAYCLKPGAWEHGAKLALKVLPDRALLARLAPYPDFTPDKPMRPVRVSRITRVKPAKRQRPRFVLDPDAHFKCYPEAELEANLWRDLEEFTQGTYAPVPQSGVPRVLNAGEGVVFDNGFLEAGFPGMHVTCTAPCRLWFTFDELLDNGRVNPVRYSVGNGIRFDLEPGEYDLEAFEPYVLKYLHVIVETGSAEIGSPFMRPFKNPEAKRAVFRASDTDLERIFEAARETFAQNAVDVFTDCPARERAGWLCDSFFTARAAVLFTGSAALERLFAENFLLPEKFDNMPDGMLPMCYPSDHLSGNFIPNWAMWFVIEMEEYLQRSGDRAMVDAFRPRLEKLIAYLQTFRNKDGLLEKLPKWVFVEWSRANHLVQDVNYPSNMTWAEVLDVMNRLYGRPDLAAEAAQVRETVRRQSWTGKWFCDNAVRQKDGSLKLSGECTETCQYYAFLFKTATPQSHPELWQTLINDFGPSRFDPADPKREKLLRHPEIWPSNAFIGNYLRLELLSRAGLDAKVLDETKGYFKYMADRTGTLWENNGSTASCDHGFASHAAVFYVRNVLGVREIDYAAKTVRTQAPNLAIESCSAELPVSGGKICYGWKRVNGRIIEHFSAPTGWRRLDGVRAINPIARDLNPRGWWQGKHAQDVAAARAGGADVIFLGDSITDFWESKGVQVWRKYFEKGALRAIDMGISGDRTEHVLWRLDHGALSGFKAKAIVLMIGTNNTGHFTRQDEPPIDTLLGVWEILQRIRTLQPQARIILHPIFPRGARPDDPYRMRNTVVNKALAGLADGHHIVWCDFTDKLLLPDGTLPTEVMHDRLHPDNYGYEAWAAAIIPYLTDAVRGVPPGDFPVASRYAALTPGIMVSEYGSGDVPEMDRIGYRGAACGENWYIKRLLAKRRESALGAHFDLVMLGDSITHGWEGAGIAEYEKIAARYRTLNLGFSGDTVQHLLWRLENGEAEGYTAKLFMIMIGTNGGGSSSKVASMRKAIALLQRHHPKAQILLLPIFPVGLKSDTPERKVRAEISAGYRALADGKRVHYLDFNAQFLNANGSLKTELFKTDCLHLERSGYAVWREAIRPVLERICGQ